MTTLKDFEDSPGDLYIITDFEYDPPRVWHFTDVDEATERYNQQIADYSQEDDQPHVHMIIFNPMKMVTKGWGDPPNRTFWKEELLFLAKEF